MGYYMFVDTTIRNGLEKINIDKILLRNIPLAPLCSFHTGGDADLLGTPSDLEELRALLEYAREKALTLTVLGGGTNVLVSDRGVRGLTIVTTRMNSHHVRGTLVCAQAGQLIDRTIQIAIEHSLGGVELLGGLPGTLGGAVRGNAGAHGVHIGDFVEWVDHVDTFGVLHRTYRDDLEFSYKHSVFCTKPDIIVEVALRLIPNKETSEAMRLREQSRKLRFSAGQFDHPSAGCMFKNPVGPPAGALIEQASLKGALQGGAAVSERHANFIINQQGDATSADILTLAERIACTVKSHSGITLEREVQLIGQW